MSDGSVGGMRELEEAEEGVAEAGSGSVPSPEVVAG